jgi:hypothetical protein
MASRQGRDANRRCSVFLLQGELNDLIGKFPATFPLASSLDFGLRRAMALAVCLMVFGDEDV